MSTFLTEGMQSDSDSTHEQTYGNSIGGEQSAIHAMQQEEQTFDGIWDRFHDDFKDYMNSLKNQAETHLSERYNERLANKDKEIDQCKGLIGQLDQKCSMLVDQLRKMYESRAAAASFAATVRERERQRAACISALRGWRQWARASAHQRHAVRIVRDAVSVRVKREAYCHWLGEAFSAYRARVRSEREATVITIRQTIEAELHDDMNAIKAEAARLKQENAMLLQAQQDLQSGVRQAFLRGASTLRMEALNAFGADLTATDDNMGFLDISQPVPRAPVEPEGEDDAPSAPVVEEAQVAPSAPFVSVPAEAARTRPHTAQPRRAVDETRRTKPVVARMPGTVRRGGSCSAGTAVNTAEMKARVKVTRGD
ncbi:hypothetical protein J8273_7837 [Carpediemonas membranifera]|uniref:Centrosomal protein POC5 n=1 Tax=Carpediemonas membranifera TaxID=201153 RepID=A0A8J6BUL8_9EUKA|nr:hypothetical protein J8273_7837 [Carpediemonas membranifera]|eukprot:KAG9390486.1 hypothetical protein J8273_7837 [Carpediemonas membranifera]